MHNRGDAHEIGPSGAPEVTGSEVIAQPREPLSGCLEISTPLACVPTHSRIDGHDRSVIPSGTANGSRWSISPGADQVIDDATAGPAKHPSASAAPMRHQSSAHYAYETFPASREVTRTAGDERRRRALRAGPCVRRPATAASAQSPRSTTARSLNNGNGRLRAPPRATPQPARNPMSSRIDCCAYLQRGHGRTRRAQRDASLSHKENEHGRTETEAGHGRDLEAVDLSMTGSRCGSDWSREPAVGSGRVSASANLAAAYERLLLTQASHSVR